LLFLLAQKNNYHKIKSRLLNNSQMNPCDFTKIIFSWQEADG